MTKKKPAWIQYMEAFMEVSDHPERFACKCDECGKMVTCQGHSDMGLPEYWCSDCEIGWTGWVGTERV